MVPEQRTFDDILGDLRVALRRMAEGIAAGIGSMFATAESARISATLIRGYKKTAKKPYGGKNHPDLDTYPGTCHTASCRGSLDPTDQEGFPNMPRRRNRQSCECGCGQMTETGRFLRGHATRRRWELIKAAELGQGTQDRSTGMVGTVEEVRNELNARRWAMPATRRTFGVEFELVAPMTAYELVCQLRLAGVNVADPSRYASMTASAQWEVKGDSSIRCRPSWGQTRVGLEIVSPPLRGKRGEAEVRQVLKVLNAANCSVNMSTGTHVHIGASDLNIDGIRRVVKTYASAQSHINGIMAPSRRNNRFARTWSGYEIERIEDMDTVQRMVEVAQRYRTVNLKPYARIGTIEFRQHQGTLNAKKVIAWVSLLRKIVEASAKSQTGVEVQRTNLRDLMTATRVDNVTFNYFMARAA